MKLLRLHVENFGTLHDFDLALSDGLNVLYQKNGWGKSTLAVFIKAMLYGLPATSRRSLDENERKKYAPWQGGAFGGSLEFVCAQGAFRIERFFGAKETADTFALYDLSTNKPSTAFSAALGEELFGIDADGFERSTYLSQRSLVTAKENNSISAKLSNLLDDVGDIGNFDTAMEALDKRRKFYTLTGNRGAIAEMEQARLDKQAELERCRRVEDAVKAQQSELDACNDEIRSAQKLIAETRARLQKAGLAREHAAHLEQKAKMLEELSRLQGQTKKIDAFFQGLPPTSGELAENERLYEEIRRTSVRLETIPKEAPEAPKLRQLRIRYPQSITTQALPRMEADNENLLKIRARRDALIGARDADEQIHRFENGAPSKEELDGAFTELEQAQNLQKAIDSFAGIPDHPPKKSARFPLAIFLTVVGVAAACLAFLPSLSAYFPILIGCGIAALCVGILLIAIAARQKNKERIRRTELENKRAMWEQQKEKLLQKVRALLESYRMPSGPDLSRALAELALLSKQYRVGMEKRRRIHEELDTLNRQTDETIARLRRAFDRFGHSLPQKEDYRADIALIRQEIAELARMEAEEVKRLHDRERAKDELHSLKEQLLPFLRRFDPVGRLRAGECLAKIGEQLSERARLQKQIREKTDELSVFIKEKRLDSVSEATDAGEYDRLTANEKNLQERLEALVKRQTLLKSGIERLSLDTDRIPDLEEELTQKKVQIDEARANAVTIANTAKLLEEAKTALSTRYLDGMQESFTRFLSDLTGESSHDALMDTSFEVRLREAGQTRTMESFSRGWRDAVQFCVRLSLTDALYRDSEPPFLLLDDPFVNLDDERLDAARALLDSLASRYQIIYLICHKERV